MNTLKRLYLEKRSSFRGLSNNPSKESIFQTYDFLSCLNFNEITANLNLH